MRKASAAPDRNKNYRAKLRASGAEEVLFQLPREMIEFIDDLKQSQGLRSRSQVLMQLIEYRKATIQQMP